MFDFIWIRFVLEYNSCDALQILQNALGMLRSGGILFVADLDHNCLNHYGIPQRLERALSELMDLLKDRSDFDPYAGRKLYTHLYDLQLEDIRVDMTAHHLIYGHLNQTDAFNWHHKVEIAAAKSGYDFSEYPDGYQGFRDEFERYFEDPRRFIYTPLILCCGRKP